MEDPNGCPEFADRMVEAYEALEQCCGRPNVRDVYRLCGGERATLDQIDDLLRNSGPDYILKLEDLKRNNGEALEAHCLTVVRLAQAPQPAAAAIPEQRIQPHGHALSDRVIAMRMMREQSFRLTADGMDDPDSTAKPTGPQR